MSMMGVGRHLVSVKQAGLGKSPSGSDQAFVVFEDENGDSMTWYSSLGFRKDGGFSKKAYDFACKALKAAGFDAEANGHDFTGLNWGAGEDMVGTKCEIVVESEEWEGKVYTKIKWVNDLSGGAPKMDQGEAAGFQSRLRAALAKEGVAVRQVPAPRPSPAAPPSSGGYDEADIPF